MAWPDDDLTNNHLDQGTDDPSQARDELNSAVLKIKAVIAGAVSAATASCVVLRDVSGNFAANFITAAKIISKLCALNGTVVIDPGADGALVTFDAGAVSGTAVETILSGTAGKLADSKAIEDAIVAVAGAIDFAVVVKTYKTSDTWVKPAGLVAASIQSIGGGAGGGGVYSSTLGFGGGGGGGAGGYASAYILAGSLGVSEPVTIGAAGTAGSGGSPGTSGGGGGTSSFGAHLSSTGGVGGTGGTVIGDSALLGGAGGLGTGGDIDSYGGSGETSVAFSSGNAISGGGGVSHLSGGGAPVSGNAAGNAGANGGGGSGGAVLSGPAGFGGGVGSSGVVIVTEYIKSS